MCCFVLLHSAIVRSDKDGFRGHNRRDRCTKAGVGYLDAKQN